MIASDFKVLELAKLIREIILHQFPKARVLAWGAAAVNLDRERGATRFPVKVFGVPGRDLESLLRSSFPGRVKLVWDLYQCLVVSSSAGCSVEISLPVESASSGCFDLNAALQTIESEESLVAFSCDAVLYDFVSDRFVCSDRILSMARQGQFSVNNWELLSKDPLTQLRSLCLVISYGLQLQAVDFERLQKVLTEQENYFWEAGKGWASAGEHLIELVECHNLNVAVNYLLMSGWVYIWFPWLEEYAEVALNRASTVFTAAKSKKISPLLGNHRSAFFWVVNLYCFFEATGRIGTQSLEIMKNVAGSLLRESHPLIRPSAPTRDLILNTLMLLLSSPSDDLSELLEGEVSDVLLKACAAGGLKLAGGEVVFETGRVEWGVPELADAALLNADSVSGQVIQLSNQLFCDLNEPLLEPCGADERNRRIGALKQIQEGVVTFLLNGDAEGYGVALIDAAGRSDITPELLFRAEALQILLRRVVDLLIMCGLTAGREFPIRVKLKGPAAPDVRFPLFVFERGSAGGVLLPDWSLFASRSFVDDIGWDYLKMRVGNAAKESLRQRRSAVFFRGPDLDANVPVVRSFQKINRPEFDVRCVPVHDPSRFNPDEYVRHKYLMFLSDSEAEACRFKELLLFRSVVFKAVIKRPKAQLTTNFYDRLFEAGKHYEAVTLDLGEDLRKNDQALIQFQAYLAERVNFYENNPELAESLATAGFVRAREISEMRMVEYTAALMARYLGAYFPWVVGY